MRYIKSIFQLFESIANIKIPNWNLIFNHGLNHDLDKKLLKRVKISESDFELFLNDVVKKCDQEKLIGDWAFVSIKLNIKLITNVDSSIKKLYIVTIRQKRRI